MNISLFGYGKTTQALSSVIHPCMIYDDKITEETLDVHHNLLKPSSSFNPYLSDLEIVSPGMPPQHHLIRQARNVISEYDYFKDRMPFSIWVSGSNGKTTTTEMTQAIFAHKNSLAGGNIGTPLAYLDIKASLWILETSSFTLHYTHFAFPQMYLLLPITPDHINWHGSFEAYKQAKLKPLSLMPQGCIAIIPKDLINEPIIKQSPAEIIFYENSMQLASYLGIDTEKIPFREPFLQDSLLALGAYSLLYQDIPYEEISCFQIGRHRLEERLDVLGRLWVNDSKATNVDAALQALKRYQSKRIHLIVGGDDKGADLESLFVLCEKLDIILYAIGSNQERLREYAYRHGISCVLCGFLKDAVGQIMDVLKADEVALLAPAAASLDQFSSYQERGDQFFLFAGV